MATATFQEFDDLLEQRRELAFVIHRGERAALEHVADKLIGINAIANGPKPALTYGCPNQAKLLGGSLGVPNNGEGLRRVQGRNINRK
ncbi:MAG: hypothetical protein O3B43_00720 [Chloroflexi bacterium]|nr:hypothetical protein [Chloroflexota bacterium]